MLPSLRREEDERVVMLGSLGALYTRGYPIDWSQLYRSGGRCVQIPSYPWQRKRFWLQTTGMKADVSLETPWRSRNGVKHPLLERYFKSASGERFWEVDVAARVFPYLADHQIQGVMLLPTSVYLEMALASAQKTFGEGPHVVEALRVHNPLALLERDQRTIQLILTAKDSETAFFQFFSLRADEDEDELTDSILHATGRLAVGPGPGGQVEWASGRVGECVSLDSPTRRHANSLTRSRAPLYLLPADVQSRCRDEVSGEAFYQGLQMGDSFRGIEKIWRRDGEALGKIRLPESLVPEADAYQVHPALLETCFHALVAALPEIPEADIYLPMGLQSFRIYSHPGGQVWSHAQLQSREALHFEGDVCLFDESGHLVLEAQGLRFQRLDREVLLRGAQERLGDWFYDIQWQPRTRLEAKQISEPGSWLIFADAGGLGDALARTLAARGQRCFMVFPCKTFERLKEGHWRIDPANPEDIHRLLRDTLEEAELPCHGVVHLWSLDAIPTEGITLPTLESAQVTQCGSALHLVQAMVKMGWPAPPHLWLVSRGVQSVRPEHGPLSLTQAPLWGLGRVIALEHPEVWGGLIDLDAGISEDDASILLGEIWEPDGEDQIAYRGEQRYVARLVRSDQMDQSPVTNHQSPVTNHQRALET